LVHNFGDDSVRYRMSRLLLTPIASPHDPARSCSRTNTTTNNGWQSDTVRVELFADIHDVLRSHRTNEIRVRSRHECGHRAGARTARIGNNSACCPAGAFLLLWASSSEDSSMWRGETRSIVQIPKCHGAQSWRLSSSTFMADIFERE